VPTVNKRTTNEMFDDLPAAMVRAAQLVERDEMDGLIVSSVTIHRHARNNVKGEHVVRYFVEVNSHD
jgi:hypothetical protein